VDENDIEVRVASKQWRDVNLVQEQLVVPCVVSRLSDDGDTQLRMAESEPVPLALEPIPEATVNGMRAATAMCMALVLALMAMPIRFRQDDEMKATSVTLCLLICSGAVVLLTGHVFVDTMDERATCPTSPSRSASR